MCVVFNDTNITTSRQSRNHRHTHPPSASLTGFALISQVATGAAGGSGVRTPRPPRPATRPCLFSKAQKYGGKPLTISLRDTRSSHSVATYELSSDSTAVSSVTKTNDHRGSRSVASSAPVFMPTLRSLNTLRSASHEIL